MNKLLSQLHLAPPPKGKPQLSGLVSVRDDRLLPCSIAEEAARYEARILEGDKKTKNIPIDYVFFRRFADGRSSQAVAYILDNSDNRYTDKQIAELHHRIWLNGKVPLFYVEWPTRVDVLRCAAEPDFWNAKSSQPQYNPKENLEIISDVSRELDAAKTKRFSAYRLSDGTFWDAPENAKWACADKAAHQSLIQAVVEVDTKIKGAKNPLMRRLLLLFILAKYLEDRGVFAQDWFAQFSDNATSFLKVLASGNVQDVEKMLDELKLKFNGDIFGIEVSFTREDLKQFATLIEARTLKQQMYLWQQYSFNYIPVEVLSHLYQHFAQKKDGAVFTPPLVVDLMLDYALPHERITGRETIFDPTCGSGIFLVGAFRRLVHYWKKQNGWEKRPGVPVLQKMLRDSIFGAELNEDAAHVAAFNLALAVCDALHPRIIWEQLTFDKLVGKNIIVGDVFANLEQIRNLAENGFTTILGNPPFKSKLTQAARATRQDNSRPIPDNQISYRVIEEAATLLALDGKMCLIQPPGFLYNSNTQEFLKKWISENTVDTILDFVSIRNLFESADAKAVAIFSKKGKPEKKHEISHLTFRRTKSLHERVNFELDHYDWHQVPQRLAEEFPSVWKANLLGGGRLVHISKEISKYPTLKMYWNEQGWTHGEGFIAGNPPANGKADKRKFADWLTGKPFLPTDAFTGKGLDREWINIVHEKKFTAPRCKERFTPPMVLIKENETLPTIFWGENDGYLTFLHKIISINAPSFDTEKLLKFSRVFEKNKKMLRAFCYLRSSQVLVGKSTAILKHDLEELPWTEDMRFMNLSRWEKILLDDILDYMAELIQVGQNSKVLTQAANSEIRKDYADLFVWLLGSVYRNLHLGPSDCSNGLAYQAFYFGEKNSKIDWPENWDEKLQTIIHKNNSVFQTSRIFHYFENDKLIIVKPNLLRHWIKSTAIWDADETLAYLYQQGF
ncbi:MAG: SAM-dependent methyltransferase [Verrucomicrobiales bacterium]|jgi:hypothetical protein|nr:SAM-dependent methyltransferase [Verrucomicrobiales bacterium]